MINHVKFINHHAQLLVKHQSSSTEVDDQHVLEQEFILGQLIIMTQYQDYSDELGRREMESLVEVLIVDSDFDGEVLDAISKTLNLVCEDSAFAM